MYRTLSLALPALLLFGGQAWAVCNTSQLCEPTDDPCVISSACTINPNSTFDIRPRALVIQKKLTVDTPTGSFSPVTIRAGSITVTPQGDIDVKATSGAFGVGGTIRLFSESIIDFQSQGNDRSKLLATGPFVGGSVEIDAVGDVTLKTSINVTGEGTEGLGGTVDVRSQTGSITITDNGGGASVNATGGTSDFGSGGSIILLAEENVLIDGELNASNGDSFAEIVIEANQGDVTTTAKGNLKVNATTLGDGGAVDIFANGNVGIAGNVEAKAAGEGGEDGSGGIGGDFTVTGANVTISASELDFRGAGPDGDGGAIDIEAAGNLIMNSIMLAEVGGFGFGGDVTLVADGTIDVRKKIDANGGDIGGTIDIFAVGDVTVHDQLLATAEFDGGDIAVQGCNVNVLSTASLVTTASPQPFPQSGSNLLIGSGQITVDGDMFAAGANILQYRNLTPDVTGTADIDPAAQLLQDPNLPCCLSCPATTTSTSITTSTSTSSTSSSTSTTAPLPTTSTSSSTSSTSTSSSSTTMIGETTSTSTSVSSTSSSSTSTSTSTSSTTSSSSTSTSTTASSTSTSSSTSSTSTSVPGSTSTTSTTPSSSTSSSTVSTTSTTSSTAAPSTTVTTSTVVTTTSTSTSSTTLPLECYEQSLPPFDAVDCNLGTIGEELNSSTDEELGGRRTKRALTKRIAKADTAMADAEQFLAEGKPEKKVVAKLSLAGRQLRAFEKKVRRGLDQGKLPQEAADFWLGLSQDASAQITLLRSNVSAQ